MDFLKKHYEKIVLCVVLLGLAGAVLWMKSALDGVQEKTATGPGGPPPRTPPPPPIDLKDDQKALAQVTNPPPLVLHGDHNLFNPVTWKRRSNGDLFKVLKIGTDALVVTDIVPLYTVITYDGAEPPVFHATIQTNVDLRVASRSGLRKVHPRIDEKNKSWPFIIRGIKGADDNPTEINLEITATGDTNVWVSKDKPYQQVESYIADLKYDPESKTLLKQKVGEKFTLDNEPYIILDIMKDAVRVQNRHNSKVTEIKWTKSP